MEDDRGGAAMDANGDFDDPLATRVGEFVGVDDLPSSGWPETFDREAVRRVLRALRG